MKDFNDLKIRHNMSLMNSIAYELFIRLYKVWFLRLIFKALVNNNEPKRMDFVVGCYNSGTTIIKDVIAAHPDVCSAPIEGDQISDSINDNEYKIAPRAMVANVCKVLNERRTGEVNSDELISDLRPWIKKGKIFLEKSISNTVRIKNLRRAFPSSKYICVTRNVDGVVRGIKKRSKPEGILRDVLGSESYPDTLLIRQWIMLYSLVLKDYSDSYDDMHFVSYEMFLSNPVNETKKIFEFMGLNHIEVELEGEFLTIGQSSFHIRGQNSTKNMHAICSYNELLSEVENVKASL